VIVVMMAALISTVGSALNSLSAVFTMDIYIKQFKPAATNKEITLIGRIVVLAGALVSIFLAIGITYIQGLSFFNIFQSVLGFIAPPMSVAFLFAVLWKKTSHKAINSVLTLGTIFSIGTGILFYNKLIFNGLHFLYVSFIIFVILGIYVFVYSLIDKKSIHTKIDYKPIKIDRSVKIAWIVLIILMIGLYLFFN
jgi:SSS family solute:Na+ symporter